MSDVVHLCKDGSNEKDNDGIEEQVKKRKKKELDGEELSVKINRWYQSSLSVICKIELKEQLTRIYE